MQGREILIALLLIGLSSCVERTLTVRSDPPEARLYLNGTEVGRTPFTHDFVWYGTYDVELRKEGYETLKARGPVIAPWWQWVPFDLLAEIVAAAPARPSVSQLHDAAAQADAGQSRGTAKACGIDGAESAIERVHTPAYDDSPAANNAPFHTGTQHDGAIAPIQ